MRAFRFTPFLLGLSLATAILAQAPTPRPDPQLSWSDTSPHKSGFVTANGIRLNYLDWGGQGPALILIHGYTDNPHIFDDLAPAFTDRFRVIAYARRAHGQSEDKKPYDTATLTEDLRGLMDGLGIAKANLAGHSMGGNEITAMAGTHPERVNRIVYLDAAYDWSDSAFVTAITSFPPGYLDPPASAMASLEAWLAFQRTSLFPEIGDVGRTEAYIRGLVVAQADATVRPVMSDRVARGVLTTSLFADRREYTKVRCPALAIYAETFFPVRNGDPARAATNLGWEQKYMAPFRTASIERVRRELPNVEIVHVSGTHMGFLFTSKEQVVSAIKDFLSGTGKN